MFYHVQDFCFKVLKKEHSNLKILEILFRHIVFLYLKKFTAISGHRQKEKHTISFNFFCQYIFYLGFFSVDVF